MAALHEVKVYEELPQWRWMSGYNTKVNRFKGVYFIQFRDKQSGKMKSVNFTKDEFDIDHDTAYLVRISSVTLDEHPGSTTTGDLLSDFALIVVAEDGSRKIAMLEPPDLRETLPTTLTTDFVIPFYVFLREEVEGLDSDDDTFIGGWVRKYYDDPFGDGDEDEDEEPIPLLAIFYADQ